MKLAHRATLFIRMRLRVLQTLWETFKLWRLSKWLEFWSKRAPNIILPANNLLFSIRASNFREKMMDIIAVLDAVYGDPYRLLSNELRLRKNALIIDIGSHIGTFTAVAAQHAPHGTVYAFEPSADNFSRLSANVKLNKFRNVKLFNSPVAADNRKVILGSYPKNSLSHSIYLNSKEYTVMQAISLESVFKKNSIKHCDFLKIDAEAAEYEILMGCPSSILKKIGTIACEYHAPEYHGITNPMHTPENLVDFLKKNNFSVRFEKSTPLGMIFATNNAQ